MPLKKNGLLTLLVLIAAPAVLAGPTFSLKIHAGAGFWLTGGDFKTYLDSTTARWEHIGYTGSINHDWKPLAAETGLQGIAMLGSHWGLALGVGYISKSLDLSSDVTTAPGNTIDIDDSFDIRSIPVSLDLLFVIPAGPFRITASAGPSLFFSSVKTVSAYLYKEPNRPGQPNWKWDYGNTFESSSKVSLGFQAGLSAEVKVFGPVSLCLDAFYRLASFEGNKGTYTWHSNQTWNGGSNSLGDTDLDAQMWFSSNEIWGQTWYYLDISAGKPTTVDEARLFKVGLSGPVIRLGIKIGL